MSPKILPLLLLLICHRQLISAELFTALADMEGLVRTERELVRQMKNFISAEEDRIRRLRGYLEEYESMYEEASTDVSKYLANPINAYLLVKRLTTDLQNVESVMVKNAYPEYFQNVSRLREELKFPSNEDLNGAATALTRLQDTYKLDTRSLAEGVLQGKKHSRDLKAGDCFELGRQSYNNQDYYHTVLWMREALQKEAKEAEKTASRQEILEYLEFATFKLGNVREALTLATQVLKMDPNHQRIKVNIKNYENILKEQETIRKHGETDSLDSTFNVIPASDSDKAIQRPRNQYYEMENYEALCRGEILLDPKIESKLRCRYVTNGVPFLFLGPMKEEEAFFNPRIVVYHDVLYDSEIATIQSLATPKFKRAVVRNVATGTYEPASYRISKAAWLDSNQHQDIAKVARRVGDATGLDMDAAEELQVVNYGIGGHYEPHYDFAQDNTIYHSPSGEIWGNRIATWLYYMSDVEAGGATVFPKLNVALWPRKGSAAFWYNLLPNGEGDLRTRHAACPVLTGSKWVSNKWIHENGQEFRRPCRLERDADV